MGKRGVHLERRVFSPSPGVGQGLHLPSLGQRDPEKVPGPHHEYHHLVVFEVLQMGLLSSVHLAGVPSKNKSSCMNTLLSYEPFSVFQDIEEENGIFLLIANGLYLNIKISVKLVFE